MVNFNDVRLAKLKAKLTCLACVVVLYFSLKSESRVSRSENNLGIVLVPFLGFRIAELIIFDSAKYDPLLGATELHARPPGTQP